MSDWAEALRVDPRRRDREMVLALALRRSLNGAGFPDVGRLADPELRRRAAYLTDLAQHLRGQTAAEGAQLARLRDSLGPLKPGPFWPGERDLPPGTDPIAERWGYTRGVDVGRLRAALGHPVDVLPEVPSAQ